MSLLVKWNMTLTWQDCGKGLRGQMSLNQHSAWHRVGYLVAQSIICQISRGVETRTQVPNSKSTILSTTCPVFLRLSLWIGQMGELIPWRKELECNDFSVPISFVHASWSSSVFYDNPNKNPGPSPGEWGWSYRYFGSRTIMLIFMRGTCIP